MAGFPRPVPEPDRDTAPFWEAQNRHELNFQRCASCQAVRYPVGPLCPKCYSFDFNWITSTGRGMIYSYTIVRHQTHPTFSAPYTILLVEMEEGPRIIAQLRGADDSAVAIGRPVTIAWDDEGDQSLPVFTLDGA